MPPDPAPAPVILPVIAPTVQVKLLGILEVRLIFGLVPLQALAVVELVTTGAGLTVTVIVDAEPIQEPEDDVGVTR